MTTGISTALTSKTAEITVHLVDFGGAGVVDKCVLTPDSRKQGIEACRNHVDSLSDD